MIHDLIEPKKRTTVRNSAAKNIKVIQDTSKTFYNNSNFELSDSENKQAETSSTTFIPLWLKNSLGLNPRLNRNLDWSVCLPNFNALGHASSTQKSARLIPKLKEQNHNEFEAAKLNAEKDCCRKDLNHFDDFNKNCEPEPTVHQCADNNLSHNEDKTIAIFWNHRLRESETESSCTSPEVKIFNQECSTIKNPNLSNEIGKFREEESRRIEIKQKNKLKKQIVSHLGKNEVDFLLEAKAQEILDNYKKKEIHSVSSDIKHLEAKLILLSAKCQGVDDAKLSQHELRLLQEIKEQTGTEEDFEKLIIQIKESNLKEIFKDSNCIAKAYRRKMKKNDCREEKPTKERFQNNKQSEEVKRPNAEKDWIISTDDENDIKRFSEFLSKNKNVDEKRKCLEEVRNYFDRKRRTRLTKRHWVDESKTPGLISPTPGDKNDLQIKEKLKMKDVLSLAKERKSKLGFYDEEVVEKAVNETLQKFVDFYHFRISPSVMGNMRKNILQAIRSDSLENNPPSQTTEVENESLDTRTNNTLNDTIDDLSVCGKNLEKKPQGCLHSEEENTNAKTPYFDSVTTNNNNNASNISSSNNKIQSKRYFKISYEKKSMAPSPPTDKEVLENENVKYLRKELENFLNSVQNHSNTTKLKLQSVILEEEGQSGLSKSKQLIYNFGKNALEVHSENMDPVGEQLKENLNNSQVKNGIFAQKKAETSCVKTQTVSAETCEQGLQTDEKIQVTNGFQTERENSEVKELRELKNFEITPGLYRMVRSREVGRFYLYPEKKKEKSSSHSICEKESSVELDEDTKKENRKDLMKFLSKDKSSKEKRVILKDRKKGKLRKIKKSYVFGKPGSMQKVLEKGTPTLENLEDSVSCLYFRNCTNESITEDFSKEDQKLNGETVKKTHQKPGSQSHLGCVWFWNGEQIPSGFDLKKHVEELLKEKLMEIKPEGPPVHKFFVNEAFLSKDESVMTNNLDSEVVKSRTFVFPFNNDNFESLEDKKLVRHVGTQNSSPKMSCGSLNAARLKAHSKTPTPTKISRSKHKRKNLAVKLSDSQENLLTLRKTANLIKMMQEWKKMNLNIESYNGPEETTETFSTQEETASSSTSKNFLDNPVTFVLGLRNKLDGEEISHDMKTKFKRTGTVVDHECQTVGPSLPGETSRNEDVHTSMEAHKHWELIENVLNRVNQKERKYFWADIRDFIKTKVGKDINDDGEVCIEIEQDLPKVDQGKAENAVLAKGHYSKNEGDVEVEIDLTLEDLERILRRRQKRIRRKQKFRASRTRKAVSSSSAQSEYIKYDLRRYQKYLQEFVALRQSLIGEKAKKMFWKNQNN